MTNEHSPDLHRLPHERRQAHPDDAAVPAALPRPRGARLQRARVKPELRVHVVGRAVPRHPRLRVRAGPLCQEALRFRGEEGGGRQDRGQSVSVGTLVNEDRGGTH